MRWAERWRDKARAAVAGRPFVGVAIGTAALRDLERFGGVIAGAISIVPASGPLRDAANRSDSAGQPAGDAADGPSGDSSRAPAEPFPVLTLVAATRQIFDLVVREFATTVGENAALIGEFLARCDPAGEAAIIATLPIPRGPFGARRFLAQDAATSRPLERKEALGPILDGLLPAVPEVRVPWPPSRATWDDASVRLVARRLVVQRLGLWGGGMATWICDSHDEAARRVSADHGEVVRLLPWIDGDPCNAMGLCAGDGVVLALPATHQVVSLDDEGRPVYAGNALGTGFTGDERRAIREDVRAIGRRLGQAGFRGPFGVDFLRQPDGSRRYHDLNPRLNGVADSLGHYLALDGGPSPLKLLLMAAVSWDADEAASFEASLDEAVGGRPSLRFLLSRAVRAPLTVERAPAAGLWRIDPGGEGSAPRATLADPGGGFAGVEGDLALLQPTVPPGLSLLPGDRLFAGDLVCAPALAAALLARHGRHAPEVLVEAVLGG